MYCNVLLLVVLLWSAGLAGACDVVSSAGVSIFCGALQVRISVLS